MEEINKDIETVEEVREPIIGEFKPKRKFLNFVSAINGAKIRFIRDIAFVKGEKLSGTLEGVIFKITICDEGTIKFEEMETNRCDKDQIQRLINDIDDTDVTGYAQKFVVAGIEFNDIDGGRCYLEVEHKKPIDVLRSFLDELDESKEEVKEDVVLSDKGMSFLDQLFSDKEEITEEIAEEVVEEKADEVKEEKLSYMEEQFRRINEEKIEELKTRIEKKGKEILTYKANLKQTETNIKTANKDLGVLESRLESMFPGEEPNGYVFYISEEQKRSDMELDDKTKEIASKIGKLIGIKEQVLFDFLTGGFYKIKIARKEDIQNETLVIDKDILYKIKTIDVSGKIAQIDVNEFEYRGELNWHQLVGKMLRKGFEQEPEFDKLCLSNSYESKEEDKKEDKCGCGCSDKKDKKVCDGDCEGCDECDGSCESNINVNMLNTKTVVEFKEPEDIVIYGGYGDGDYDFSITDDYTSFDLYVGDKKVENYVESDGFVNVMKLSDFMKLYKKHENEFSVLDACDAILLPSFTGKIGVGALNNKTGKTDYQFNFEDIAHQFDDDDDISVFVKIPEGSEYALINEKNIVALLRDGKLNKILN